MLWVSFVEGNGMKSIQRATLVVIGLCATTVLATLGVPALGASEGATGMDSLIYYRRYVVARDEWDIRAMRPDGSGDHFVLTPPSNCGGFRWSPDGSRIAFACDGSDTFLDDIWMMNADGTGATRLTTSARDEGDPAWSPDGLSLAFFRAKLRAQSIFTLVVDDPLAIDVRVTGPALRTREFFRVDSDPSWSPSGDRIAFQRDRVYPDWPDDRFSVRTVPSSGGPSTIVRRDLLDPSWSPGGERIAAQDEVGRFILTLESDGSDPTQIVPPSDDFFYGGADWSPDAGSIAFAGGPDDYSCRRWFIAPADGSADPQRIFDRCLDTFLDWVSDPG